MGNMSYCRFRNTLGDLDDCWDHLEEDMDDLSDEEKMARKTLIKVCCNIAADYGNEVGIHLFDAFADETKG